MAYFAPETEQHLTAAGLRPGRMSYFAGRSAPMGEVGPGVVTAAFYNFNPALVARSIPAAWSLADPATVIAARFVAVDAALRRMLGDAAVDSPEVAEAAGLARRAAEACRRQGRPLAAAHLDLEWPTEPHLVLWHAVTILREHRGDGHVALLLGAGFDGLEALVTHTATGKGFIPAFAMASRGWSQEQWAAAALGRRARHPRRGGHADRGGHGGAQADRGRHRPARRRAVGAPRTEGAARLGELGGAVVRSLLAAGCFPKDGVFASGR